MASHEWWVCRMLYLQERKAGSPVVNILDLGRGYFAGETADGKVIQEHLEGCCKWAMKYKVAKRWNEINDLPG